MTTTLQIAVSTDENHRMAEALGAATVWLPEPDETVGWEQADEFEAWRDANRAGAEADFVLVSAGADVAERGNAVDLDPEAWIHRTEMPLARWTVALAVAAGRVVEGGSIVVVVDQPAPLDSVGWAPETAVADAVEALVRSLAKSEGATRGVRVNLVTTPRRLVTTPVSPPPSLRAFPGTLADVIAVVETMRRGDAELVTGAVIHADGGRAYR